MTVDTFNLKDSLLYQDENLLVLNKPAGLIVHGDGKSPEVTLADLILKEFPELKEVGEPMEIRGEKIYRPGIVHRLDRDTSGCILVARNQDTFLFLKNQFQNHTIQKVYHAFVYGSLKEDSGEIHEPIGRSKDNIRKWATGRGARGELRDASTNYTVLARYGLKADQKKGSTEEGTYTYIEARPKTGRTHQIRVHMRYLNHPIVGDTLYAPNRAPALGFERLALHARSITFQLSGGKLVTIEAPFPEDFKRAQNIAL